MSIKPYQYEELLAEYSDHLGAIALLREFRPYMEMIPSMRRPNESVITIPLPVVHLHGESDSTTKDAIVRLPCDVAVLMCDPEWKIKTGVEIFVFIHRPNEEFSDLLGRWRQTQILVHKNYEWLMPRRYRHILSEGAEETCPLFVVFPESHERIRRGLRGAALPYVVQTVNGLEEDLHTASTEIQNPAEKLD
jgi:hypothetical protein